MNKRPDAVLIAGPTASGKTSAALELAEALDGEIINADSMQVYPVLNVLTARPGAPELDRVPHHLYGHAPLDQPYSVAHWLSDVAPVFEDIVSRNKVPLFVGGTGLYFTALIDGLAEVPPIPQELRESVRADLKAHGSQWMHGRLAEHDAEGALALKPGDSHRIARALEVVLATGKPLAHFHKNQSPGLLQNVSRRQLMLMPDRAELHRRINQRSGEMLASGAIQEVESLLALGLPDNATVLRAIGVSQVAAYIGGNISLQECENKLQIATRQYAKRQATWFNNRFFDWKIHKS